MLKSQLFIWSNQNDVSTTHRYQPKSERKSQMYGNNNGKITKIEASRKVEAKKRRPYHKQECQRMRRKTIGTAI